MPHCFLPEALYNNACHYLSLIDLNKSTLEEGAVVGYLLIFRLHLKA